VADNVTGSVKKVQDRFGHDGSNCHLSLFVSISRKKDSYTACKKLASELPKADGKTNVIITLSTSRRFKTCGRLKKWRKEFSNVRTK
jgi:hypothetical protein